MPMKITFAIFLKKNDLFSYFKGNITSCTGNIPYKPYKDGYVIGSKS